MAEAGERRGRAMFGGLVLMAAAVALDLAFPAGPAGRAVPLALCLAAAGIGFAALAGRRATGSGLRPRREVGGVALAARRWRQGD